MIPFSYSFKTVKVVNSILKSALLRTTSSRRRSPWVGVVDLSMPSQTMSNSLNQPNGPLPPVVVVLGSTASGKSKLAIDLAKEVPGEVISADSMQVYEGLDILTNKATHEEMQAIPHHMIGVVDRTVKFDVVKFREMALPLVDKIRGEGKVPYIVGGTNYYIESLLWKVLIDEDFSPDSHSETESVSGSDSESPVKRLKLTVDDGDPIVEFALERRGNFTDQEMLEKWSIKELHEALTKVDPERATKFHPNDVRKIVRSLQVYFRTGRKHSEIIEEQCHKSEEETTSFDGELEASSDIPRSLQGKLGGPMRYSNCICFWIQADRDILNQRIEDRVDKMVERGIRQELDSYVDQINNEDNRKWDFQEGQLQSIGVKEFQSYIQLPPEARYTDLGNKAFTEGLDRLKIVTRQYAKRQVQWVKQRFLKSTRRQLPIVYGLDGNDVSADAWNNNIFTPALEILNAHVQGDVESPLMKEKRLPVVVDDEGEKEDFISRNCEICDKVLVGSSQYQIHMRSAKHWKMVKRKKKLEEKKEFLESASAENENQISDDTVAVTTSS